MHENAMWKRVRWAGREDEIATIVGIKECPQPDEEPDDKFVRIKFDNDDKDLIVNVIDLTFV